MGFRGEAIKPEVWFDFYLKGEGYLGLKELPGREYTGFRLGNLYWKPLKTGYKWEIGYEGALFDKKGNKFPSEVRLIFTGRHPIYDFVSNSDKNANASAIAAEKWTGEFFQKLRELSQTHYEQSGTIEGIVKIGERVFHLEMDGLRDHSFGPRNWSNWERHYWMSGISDNGISWTVTTVRYNFINRLTAGCITDAAGKTDVITRCTGLDEISQNELWPAKGVVKIETAEGKFYQLGFKRKGHFSYLMDNCYHMLEGIGSYHLNDAPGIGMIEFGFAKDKYNINPDVF
jgi:hypothetical protein